MLSVIILCDIIITAVRAGCSMHIGQDNTSYKICSITVISLFALFEALFIIVGIIVGLLSCRCCRKLCSKCCSICCSIIILCCSKCYSICCSKCCSKCCLDCCRCIKKACQDCCRRTKKACQDCCRRKKECQTCDGTKCTKTECRNTCSAIPKNNAECTEEECKNRCPCCEKCGNKSNFCGKRQRRDDEENAYPPECPTCNGTKCEETKCWNSCNATQVTQHVTGECTEEERTEEECTAEECTEEERTGEECTAEECTEKKCKNKCPCCGKCRNKSLHCGVKHRKEKEQDYIDSAVRIITFFAVLVASSLYFVGDNLLNILDKYGNGFSCGSGTNCYKCFQKFSISCLAIGGGLYIITLVFKIKNKDKAPQNSASSTYDGPISIGLYLLYLPMFDSIYTGVVTSIGLADDCTTYRSDVKTVYWIIYVLIAALLIIAFVIKIILTECTPQGTPTPQQEQGTPTPQQEQGTRRRQQQQGTPKLQEGTPTPLPEQGTPTPLPKQSTPTPLPEQGTPTLIPKKLCGRVWCQIFLAVIVVSIIFFLLLADNEFPMNCEIQNYKVEIAFRIIFLAPGLSMFLFLILRCKYS